MTPDISSRSLTQIGLQIPRWRTKQLPCKAMAVSQAFIFHFKCYSILHFAVCQLLRWHFLVGLQTSIPQRLRYFSCNFSATVSVKVIIIFYFSVSVIVIYFSYYYSYYFLNSVIVISQCLQHAYVLLDRVTTRGRLYLLVCIIMQQHIGKHMYYQIGLQLGGACMCQYVLLCSSIQVNICTIRQGYSQGACSTCQYVLLCGSIQANICTIRQGYHQGGGSQYVLVYVIMWQSTGKQKQKKTILGVITSRLLLLNFTGYPSQQEGHSRSPQWYPRPDQNIISVREI